MEIKALTAGGWNKAQSFLKDVRVELTKVTWPSWPELKGQTIVVIIAVLLISAFIGGVDLVLNGLITTLLKQLS